MSSELARKECKSCDGGTPALKGDALRDMMNKLGNTGWNVAEEKKLRRQFKFSDFKSALAFVNKVGAIAEEQGHHPNICFTWGEVNIEIWTHKVGGLTESDFILAAKISEIK